MGNVEIKNRDLGKWFKKNGKGVLGMTTVLVGTYFLMNFAYSRGYDDGLEDEILANNSEKLKNVAL